MITQTLSRRILTCIAVMTAMSAALVVQADDGPAEPLAEHLAPPPFTEKHAARLRSVIDQSAVLVHTQARLPADTPPEELAEIQSQIDALKIEWKQLEAQKQIWKAWQQKASEPPAIVAQRDTTRVLDRRALIRLYKDYWFAKEFMDEANIGKRWGPDETSWTKTFPGARRAQPATPPSADDWERLGARFESVLAGAQTLSGLDGALALHGRLLQGSCYLFASVTHFAQDNQAAHLQNYLRGIRVLDWVIGHDGIAPELPMAMQVDDYDFPRWPYAHFTVLGASSVDQAKALMSDFCPWGPQVYLMLSTSGMMNAFDWRCLPPYGSEKVSVMELADYWVPDEILREVEPIVSGAFAAKMGETNFKWGRAPKPTFTIWYVSPAEYDMEASEILGWTLKAIKLVVAGPEALLVDQLKGITFDKAGYYFGQGSGVHWMSGHVGNLLDVKFIEGHWLSPEAQWTLFTQSAGGVRQFTPSKALGTAWADVLKGALMDTLKYLEKRETELLFDSIDPKNNTINAAFGNPKTYDGSSMPPIIIRTDIAGWQVMPDIRYRRMWHIVKYHRLDTRAILGAKGLSETATERANRKGAQWAGKLTLPQDAWQELPNKPKTWGTRIHLSDFSPNAQVLRFRAPRDVVASWREKASDEGKSLFVEFTLPGALAKYGPIHKFFTRPDRDLHLAKIEEGLSDHDVTVREGLWRALDVQAWPKDEGKEPGEEAIFILNNGPAALGLPGEWSAPYAALLHMGHLDRKAMAARLTKRGVKPLLLPYLATEYEARIVLAKTSGDDSKKLDDVEELAKFPVNLIVRPGKVITGKQQDLTRGCLLVDHYYKGEAEIRKPPGLPFKRCMITASLWTHITDKHTYSEATQEVNPGAPRPVGEKPEMKVPDPWEGYSKGGKKVAFVAVGSFSGNTFTGKIEGKIDGAKFKKTEKGTVTVTLGGPFKEMKDPRDPPGQPPVKIPTTVASFSASSNVETSSTQTGIYNTSTTMTLSGSAVPINEKASTVLQPPIPLRQLFKNEMMQRRSGWISLVYWDGGEDAKSSVKLTWHRTENHNNKAHVDKNLVESKWPSGYVTISFQFH